MAPMAPGVSAEEMHLRVPFPGRQMSAIADAPGPHILLEAGGLLLDPDELLRRLRRQQGLCPSHEKLGGGVGEHCGDGSAKWTARRAWEWRVGGCGRTQGQGLGGRKCKIARCAANMAADGRKVLGRDGAASPGDQGGAWQSRGRNLTALGADGAPTTRENLALRAP